MTTSAEEVEYLFTKGKIKDPIVPVIVNAGTADLKLPDTSIVDAGAADLKLSDTTVVAWSWASLTSSTESASDDVDKTGFEHLC